MRSVDASYRPASRPTSKLPGAGPPSASYNHPQNGGIRKDLSPDTSLEVNVTDTWTDVSWVEKVLELKRYLVVVYGGNPYDIHGFEFD